MGKQHISALSLPRVGSGQREERSRPGLLSWLSLAEGSGVFAKHLVCRAVLEGLYPPLCCTSVVSPHADKSQSQSPCGESAYSLMLIPGRFPSSRKHKPPSSIIHQVLNFIKEPPDTRAGCSTLLPGWESAGSGRPEGPRQEARPVSLVSGWAILLSEQADSTRTLVSLLPLFINKHLLLIPPGSLSHCKAKYKT